MFLEIEKGRGGLGGGFIALESGGSLMKIVVFADVDS